RAINVELDSHHRVEGQAGAVDAQFPPRVLVPESVTNEREDKELRDALDRELLVGVANGEELPLNPGNTHAEGAGRCRGQGRDIVGDGPLAEITIAFVSGRDESPDVSIGREYPGRYSLDPRAVVGERITIHVHPLLGEYWPAALKLPGPVWSHGSPCLVPVSQAAPAEEESPGPAGQAEHQSEQGRGQHPGEHNPVLQLRAPQR